MKLVLFVALALASGFAGIRWLRVAQREHYLAGSVLRFAWRWWTIEPRAIALAVAAIAGVVLAVVVAPAFVLLTAGAAVLGPPGLSLRGRTGQLVWTSRLRRLAIVTAIVLLAGLSIGWMVHVAIAGLVVMSTPLLVDLSLAVLAPLETRLGRPWVEKATRALDDAGATVVAVTGSYGKTSTKGYIAHLLSGSRRVLASPASFNNRMGLARAINEHLAAGIDVFVAEMGTYGKGEIAELCEWIPPDVAVITAIGPVHLERFGSEEKIVEAKAEILERAPVAVLNVDDPRLRRLAEKESQRRRVVTAGISEPAAVKVKGSSVSVDGVPVGEAPSTAHPGNVACAVAVAVALGVEPDVIGERLPGLTEPDHRRTVSTAPSGVAIIDDTFNSNPAGARAALALLADMEVAGRRVLVTPGMVELGGRQYAENRSWAEEAAATVDVLAVVGRTNRRALLDGANGGKAEIIEFPDLGAAVDWVRSNLGPGDAVLYENDLPDHYP